MTDTVTNQVQNETGWGLMRQMAKFASGFVRGNFPGVHQTDSATDVVRADSFQNLLTGLNTGRDKVTHAKVKSPTPLSVQEIADLMSGDHLAMRIVQALPDEALREGFRLVPPKTDSQGNEWDTEAQAEGKEILIEHVKKFEVQDITHRAACFGRGYGRAAILLGIEGAGESAEPYDPETNPGKLAYMHVLDRRDFSVATWNTDTGQPETWMLNTGYDGGSTLGSEVHTSRLVFFGGLLTSDRDRRRLQHSDWSVLQPCMDPIRDVHTMWSSVVHLVSDASQGVFKIKGLFDMITQGNIEPILLRFGLIDQGRSVVRSFLLDTEDEEFHREATSFAGIPDTIDRGWEWLASAAGMSKAQLMGSALGGMGSNGESEMKLWYGRVSTYQIQKLTNPLTQIVNLIAVSIGLPKGWSIEWPSLWDMSPTEEAEHRTKVTAADKSEIDSGILVAEEVAAHRHSGQPDAWTTPVPIDLETRQAIIDHELASQLRDAQNKGKPTPPPASAGEPASAPTGTPASDATPTPGPDPVVTASPTTAVPKDPAESLNGAQMTSLVAVITAVATKQIPRATGVALIVAGYAMSAEQADSIMGEVGNTFFVASPAPTPGGFGG